jgi:hypothetical protein
MTAGSELPGAHSARLPMELNEPKATIEYGDPARGWA